MSDAVDVPLDSEDLLTGAAIKALLEGGYLVLHDGMNASGKLTKFLEAGANEWNAESATGVPAKLTADLHRFSYALPSPPPGGGNTGGGADGPPPFSATEPPPEIQQNGKPYFKTIDVLLDASSCKEVCVKHVLVSAPKQAAYYVMPVPSPAELQAAVQQALGSSRRGAAKRARRGADKTVRCVRDDDDIWDSGNLGGYMDNDERDFLKRHVKLLRQSTQEVARKKLDHAVSVTLM